MEAPLSLLRLQGVGCGHMSVHRELHAVLGAGRSDCPFPSWS